MKKNKSTIILILVFFVGLSVMLYPTLSDYVNQLQSVPRGGKLRAGRGHHDRCGLQRLL